ncbi:hypothetical protein PENSPDRAFT_658016 [Peniophora sp. CONT]|nr:hypothetical protein PENSPDRAFT_658016 [Peniophora sp. CONT]
MPNAHSTSPNMIGPGAYHHSASNFAVNHTGSFGASSVRASNAYNNTGHLMPPTSIQLNDHGASLSHAPMIPTATNAFLPTSPASIPSMTEGSSRSSSYGPGTPGVNNAASPSALNLDTGPSSTLIDDPIAAVYKCR